MASFQEWRAAQLRGAAEARSIHERLGIRQSLADGTRPIDVFDAIRALGRTLVFQPLKGLLGAYLRHREVAGMIVTTERDLHIQRFTAAHELGHAELEHPSSSIDKEIGFAARGPASTTQSRGYGVYEIEADAFASEFLLPKWLLAAHTRRRGWTVQDLSSPDVVYQLSLRLGTSYSATCWALVSNSILPRSTVEKLLKTAPKVSKERALRGTAPDNWKKTDVWVLNSADSGIRVLGDPNDRLVINLEEHATSGYIWEVAQQMPGLVVERSVTTPRIDTHNDVVGTPSQGTLILSGEVHARVTLVERRPWDPIEPPLNCFEIDLDLRGPESAGLPRAVRQSPQ